MISTPKSLVWKDRSWSISTRHRLSTSNVAMSQNCRL